MPILTNEQISKRQELVERLLAAAELEHQFTCMYLFAAFSLKKETEGASFNDLGVEITRRWASTIYMVSRQEMEHLAIVNQLLAAIGEPPCFYRRNIPYQPDFFRAPKEGIDKSSKKKSEKTTTSLPCDVSAILDTKKVATAIDAYENGEREGKVVDEIENAIVNQNKLLYADIPFLFTPFDLRAARRYTVMESPMIAHLVLSCQLEIAKDIVNWGFKKKKGNFNCILPPDWQKKVKKEKKKKNKKDNKGDVHVGDIERYYSDIRENFKSLGNGIFVPPSAERQVKIINQYNIHLFPITDIASAKNGIDLIIKQGEAVGSSPGFDSHFRHFYDITKEYEEALEIKKNKTKGLARSYCDKNISYKKLITNQIREFG